MFDLSHRPQTTSCQGNKLQAASTAESPVLARIFAVSDRKADEPALTSSHRERFYPDSGEGRAKTTFVTSISTRPACQLLGHSGALKAKGIFFPGPKAGLAPLAENLETKTG